MMLAFRIGEVIYRKVFGEETITQISVQNTDKTNPTTPDLKTKPIIHLDKRAETTQAIHHILPNPILLTRIKFIESKEPNMSLEHSMDIAGHRIRMNDKLKMLYREHAKFTQEAKGLNPCDNFFENFSKQEMNLNELIALANCLFKSVDDSSIHELSSKEFSKFSAKFDIHIQALHILLPYSRMFYNTIKSSYTAKFRSKQIRSQKRAVATYRQPVRHSLDMIKVADKIIDSIARSFIKFINLGKINKNAATSREAKKFIRKITQDILLVIQYKLSLIKTLIPTKQQYKSLEATYRRQIEIFDLYENNMKLILDVEIYQSLNIGIKIIKDYIQIKIDLLKMQADVMPSFQMIVSIENDVVKINNKIKHYRERYPISDLKDSDFKDLKQDIIEAIQHIKRLKSAVKSENKSSTIARFHLITAEINAENKRLSRIHRLTGTQEQTQSDYNDEHYYNDSSVREHIILDDSKNNDELHLIIRNDGELQHNLRLFSNIFEVDGKYVHMEQYYQSTIEYMIKQNLKTEKYQLQVEYIAYLLRAHNKSLPCKFSDDCHFSGFIKSIELILQDMKLVIRSALKDVPNSSVLVKGYILRIEIYELMHRVYLRCPGRYPNIKTALDYLDSATADLKAIKCCKLPESESKSINDTILLCTGHIHKAVQTLQIKRKSLEINLRALIEKHVHELSKVAADKHNHGPIKSKKTQRANEARSYLSTLSSHDHQLKQLRNYTKKLEPKTNFAIKYRLYEDIKKQLQDAKGNKDKTGKLILKINRRMKALVKKIQFKNNRRKQKRYRKKDTTQTIKHLFKRLLKVNKHFSSVEDDSIIAGLKAYFTHFATEKLSNISTCMKLENYLNVIDEALSKSSICPSGSVKCYIYGSTPEKIIGCNFNPKRSDVDVYFHITASDRNLRKCLDVIRAILPEKLQKKCRIICNDTIITCHDCMIDDQKSDWTFSTNEITRVFRRQLIFDVTKKTILGLSGDYDLALLDIIQDRFTLVKHDEHLSESYYFIFCASLNNFEQEGQYCQATQTCLGQILNNKTSFNKILKKYFLRKCRYMDDSEFLTKLMTYKFTFLISGKKQIKTVGDVFIKLNPDLFHQMDISQAQKYILSPQFGQFFSTWASADEAKHQVAKYKI